MGYLQMQSHARFQIRVKTARNLARFTITLASSISDNVIIVKQTTGDWNTLSS